MMMPNSLGYWRDYFRTANLNVFDIIDGAITVAASDCPQEFKIRRDQIAERLFSCRLTRCSGIKRVELAVSSVDEAVDRDEDNGLMKSGIAGDGDVLRRSKGSKVNSTARDDSKDLTINCEADALADEIEEEFRILEEVSRIKEILMKYEDEAESVLFESLRRLQFMELTVAMLKVTGIGLTVNLLRKYKSKQISQLAQALISSWKSMVDEWIETKQDILDGTPESVNPLTVVDEEEEGLPSSPLDEGAFPATEPTSMELSGFVDGSDQQIQSRTKEAKNPTRHEKPEPLRKGCPTVKSVNGNSERGWHPDPSAVRKINRESKPQLRRLENPAITKREDSEAAFQMKFESTKRKMQACYREAESAKKQRTAQVIELKDLPKRAGAVVNRRNATARPGNQTKRCFAHLRR